MSSVATETAVTLGPAVSERLAEHIVDTTFEELPAAVVEHAKDLLVYNLSVAFAGRFTDEGRQMVALAHELSAGGDAATIVGHRQRATLLDAIFAHSELLGEEEDIHLASKVRAGRVAQPVAWVLGEHVRATGRELIAALVVGYDAACKLAEPLPMAGNYTRMPHKCAFAPFAPAAVAARLLRQDRARAAETIAHAAHFGMGTNEGYNEAFVFGLMARNGVMAALLPGLQRAESLRAIESPHGLYAALFGGTPEGLEASLNTLGREFSIMGSPTKRYPGSLSHIAALEAGRELLEGSTLRANGVASLVAVLPEEFRGRFAKRELVIEPPARERELVSSLRLRLAMLFVESATFPQPTLEHLHDPEVQALLPKIRLEFEPRPDDYARIEIRTTDGRTLAGKGRVGPSPKGDWSAWLRKDGERFLSEEQLAALERQLTHLEDVDDVGEILRCTVPRDDLSPER